MASGFRMFALIWGGQLVSVLGSELSGFALMVWVYQTTGSATLSTLAFWAYSLPQILFSPFAGVLVDRWGRRRAMIVSDLGAAAFVGLGALLWFTGQLNPWMCLPLNFGVSLFNSLMWPAQSAAITVLVPKEHYGRANGMLQAVEAFAQLAGPALAGLAYATLGLGRLALIDVATYGVSIFIMVVLVRMPEPSLKTEQAAKPSMLSEIRLGWDWIVGRQEFLILLSYFLVGNLLNNFTNPLFGPYILDLWDAGTLGWISSILGVGMLVGTLIMSAWGGTKRRIHTLLGAGVLSGIFLAMAGLVRTPGLLALVGALMMVLMPMMNGSSQAIWQAKVPADLQGRVFSVRRSIAWSSGLIAPLLAGPLADLVFKPGMLAGGALAPIFGPLVGTGPGRGIGLMLVIVGLANAVISIGAFFVPSLVNLEKRVPDAPHPSGEPKLAPEPVAESAAVEAATEPAEAEAVAGPVA